MPFRLKLSSLLGSLSMVWQLVPASRIQINGSLVPNWQHCAPLLPWWLFVPERRQTRRG
jgi:hypothetical protein